MMVSHIGYAVRSLEKAAEQFVALGYVPEGGVTCDRIRHVRIQFLRNNDHIVELVAPLDPESPVNDILRKKGSSPYHICYGTNMMSSEVERLKKQGFKLISAPLAAPALNGHPVCFMFSPFIGLIELVEL